MNVHGRILGIDYGTRRIGIAITDPSGTMVFPRPILLNKSLPFVLSSIVKLCADEHVREIVIGFPYHEDHTESAQTARVQAFGDALRDAVQLPVQYEDEKFTTAEAEMMLDAAHVPFSDRKKIRDSVAAMLIVQAHLKKL